jgi:hypothetical protein
MEKRVGNAVICRRDFKKEVKTSQKTICRLKFPMFTDPDPDMDTILRASNFTLLIYSSNSPS